MQPLHLFSLASQNNHWLATRQSLLAANIANANTPGYKAVDIEPFEEAIGAAGLQMAATATGHLVTDSPAASAATAGGAAGKSAGWETYYSGNNVSLEQELLKSAEVNRDYSFNTSVLKTFQRMLIASSKG